MLTLIRLSFCSRVVLIAENLFLRKQLALFHERKAKPRRTTPTIRLTMVALSRFVNWRDALVIVKPETFIKWHRTAFRLFWRRKSRKKGRPQLPKNLRELIQAIGRANPTWGEERIADEFLLKLGLRLSPATVRKYLSEDRPRGTTNDQRWATFVRNHANAIVACDFFVSVTFSFRVLYVFVAMEIGSRRILHCNVTDHPSAEWTIQQFREFLAFDHPYRLLIHDRDAIFSSGLDTALQGFGVCVLIMPVRAPQANAFCERLIGTLRRECLDFLIPLNQKHLRLILKEFVCYYNRGRPHSSLGPGIPEPTEAKVPAVVPGHKLPASCRVRSKTVLGGLHHEYWLEEEAA